MTMSCEADKMTLKEMFNNILLQYSLKTNMQSFFFKEAIFESHIFAEIINNNVIIIWC